MKRILMIPAVLLLSCLAFTPSARADWGFQIGIGVGGGQISGGYYHGSRHVHHRPVYHRPVYHRPVHVHARVPVYTMVWVPPVYDRVIVGYTACGRPIRETVMVRAGYHKRVITGYRCSSCNAVCY